MQGKVSSKQDAACSVYVGVDVCKEWLDIHIHPQGKAGGSAMTRAASAS
jgi:hypothetical protein